MKKILLTLGTTIAIASPAVAVVSCSSAKTKEQAPNNNPTKTKVGETNGSGQTTKIVSSPWSKVTDSAIKTFPWSKVTDTATQISTVTKGIPWELATNPATQIQKLSQGTPWELATSPAAKIVQNQPAKIPFVADHFTITDVTENPKIDKFLDDVEDAPADFKVYDNGLFKIKIQKSLIGTGKFFADESKALLQAKEVANSINYGPAITHLPKGIQILESKNVASLGGNDGVQIAVTNKRGSVDDTAIKNEAALIDHEYGHHETMWDIMNLLGVDIINDVNPDKTTFKEVMSKGLRDAGYDKIADVVDAHVMAKNDLTFIPGDAKDFPSAYGPVEINHNIFNNANYPLNAVEIATRVLNILSYRTELNAQEMYKYGGTGKFSNGQVFDIPANLVSDATIKHFTGQAIFGEGKDDSKASKLIDFYMKDVFGLGKGEINLIGDAKTGEMKGINFDSFGIVDGLDTIEIQDSMRNIIQTIKVKTFNSRFGFKKELITDKWDTVRTEEVSSIYTTSNDFKVSDSSDLKLVGKDVDGNEVDLSGVDIGFIHTTNNSQYYDGTTEMIHEGNHFSICGAYQ